ncbi:MAG: regulator [Micrococcales bacterium 70-64]|nr:regulator [Leifsonia sp.]ODU64402.1 MAG: regulator [Leifsonia sp. SCN 70-46]OJX86093.1 MAG: regulator [Micrococcales bacterium 70-64]
MRVALALPSPLGDEHAAQALRHGHEVVARATGAADAEPLIAALRPDALVVASDPRYLSARVLAACDDSGVRLVAVASSDADRALAASLGLVETVDASSGWSSVELALGGAPRPAPVGAPLGHGTVITVWGPGGAPGRTTIAIGVAAELAALGRGVVLADVDTHGASIAPALGMLDESPGFAAACRLAGTDALSHAELARLAQEYRSPLGGFRVLTGIGRPSRWPELSGERVAKVIALCRTWAEVTVVDVGSSLENDEEISSDLFAPRRNAAAVTAVREADIVIAVGSADPVGMSRFLRAHADLLEVSSAREVVVVMNRVRATAIGMNPRAQVEQTLSRFGGVESPVLVPHDQAALDGAVLAGRTLADSAPRSAARLAIRSLVAERLTLRHVDPQ